MWCLVHCCTSSERRTQPDWRKQDGLGSRPGAIKAKETKRKKEASRQRQWKNWRDGVALK